MKCLPRGVAVAMLLIVFAAAAGAQDLATVTVAPPKPASPSHAITLPASLDAFERVAVQAKVAGYIGKLNVDVGSRVKGGDVIAVIDAPEMQQQVKLAEAKVAAAEAALAKAQAHAALRKVTRDRLARVQAAEAGAVSQLDVEVAAAEHQAAESEVGVARANIQVATADLSALKTLLAYTQIKAPFDGVVTQRSTDVGALVGGSGATNRPIVEIIRVHPLRLAFDVPERLLWCFQPQQKVAFSIEAIPGKTLQAVIARRTWALDSRTRSMRMELDVENPDLVFAPGMYATVRISVGDLNNAFVVPAAALRSVGGQASVLIVDPQQTIRRVPVLVLLDDGKEASVSGQLPAGASIVVAGPGDLADGQRVQVRAEAAAK